MSCLFLLNEIPFYRAVCLCGFQKDNSIGIVIQSCTICALKKGFEWSSHDWVAPVCQRVAAKILLHSEKAVLHLHANQANPLHLHALTHKHAFSLSLSPLQCFSYSVSPVGMDTYAHHNIHSCTDEAWKQALIKFSLCVLCTQCGRYQSVLSEGLSYLNMEVNRHWRYLMSAHSRMAASIDLPTLELLGVCRAGFCFSVI